MNFLKKWWSTRHLEQTQVKDAVCVETRTEASPANESKPLSTKLERFLKKNYEFRYNVLTEQAEVRATGEQKFRAVTQRVANTLCLAAQEAGIPCWDKDVLRLLNSERLTDFHPLLTYMAELPSWDGIDRVTPLAHRISTKAIWVNGFHRWMLGVAAQWSGQMDRCANAVAPMLISARQGMGKSTFGRQLVPESLADYYTDSFDLNSQAGCEQKLSLFGLINLDEYDKLSSRKLPLLKNLMQMTALHYRKAHRAQYSHLPRMASFIGTSNRRDLLNDPTGSRRYLCIEVEKKIENTPLEHKQLFAQLMAELANGERYWFTGEEEKELMKHNEPYYIQPPMHDVFFQCFRLPEKGEAHQLYTSSYIYSILLKRFPKVMRGMNAHQFGKTLTLIGAERVHTVQGNVYRVVEI
ncbi:MAG: DUF3874 domain-containing protein [Bacteroides sp.]|nr:DUF3874 domain-containing protein [Bacteroides sp.]